MVKCYYCNTTIPAGEVKRCGRCRLVTYCSKNCQTISWKASHKANCRPHPSLLLPNGGVRSDKPAKGTDERLQLDIDMALSSWLAKWRTVFQINTTLALDFAHNPPDYGVTHCLYLIVEPLEEDLAKCKKYRLVEASIASVADLDAKFPEFGGIVDDTNDTLRVRFVLQLRDMPEYGCTPLRMRRVQWSDLNILRFRDGPKGDGAADKFSEFHKLDPQTGEPIWAVMLKHAVETMEAEEATRKYGMARG
ncbi:hypothetical protein EXIGLDRAFT_835036 [Exidia glandulosa HHB12029]|uniref:MYND-type domain-containing protein n=1 Tax=Exidia glandulosa HHB12029 TaxID=1314781 RepID=A0A165J4W9_EXIGL|nr:hypothetical protein EXIGLDRAFT_835036 [Exidia glandulosa HHB12029]